MLEGSCLFGISSAVLLTYNYNKRQTSRAKVQTVLDAVSRSLDQAVMCLSISYLLNMICNVTVLNCIVSTVTITIAYYLFHDLLFFYSGMKGEFCHALKC